MRYAISVDANSKHLTKEEAAYRRGLEQNFKGNGGIPICPDYLTEPQKEIFHFILDNLIASDVVSSLDVFTLTNTSVAIDRLQNIEMQVNENPDLMTNSKLMSSRKVYEATMWRGVNELCMSPQARAKIGSLMSNKAKDAVDPLVAALGGEPDE